ncbi:3'-5' exonuclease [Sphingobium sp. WCS2017Hpa-17]|uniref:3'-5' exonuclease n=1 Tax=Sphingobium sp. WCS2017Hpa-17 TaxID=3073638 RepID=UPI00288C0E6B|nr:3'-5' exonuclease [Sphingobium sp. WCS2017Hpa-17]
MTHNIVAAQRAAALLDAHPDYRVLRALPPVNQLVLPEPEGKTFTAIILDTETTSLDPATGRIIELALCPVRFDQRGRIVGIGAIEDWLEDTGEPLSADIRKLTGLTDEDLADQRIDDNAVLGHLTTAQLIVAHNARFDLGWIEARFPSAGPLRWACSMSEIDWVGHGYEARKLGGLLADAAGYFNRRHRADNDVAALVALLTTALPPGYTAFAEMLFTAAKPTARIIAERAPYAARARLKQRSYRWDDRRKAWWREVPEDERDAELAWLRAEVGGTAPIATTITWFERHRA